MARRDAQTRNARGALLAWLALTVIIIWLLVNWPRSAQNQATEVSAPVTSQETTETTVTQPKATEQKAEVVAKTLNFRSRPEYEDRTIIKTLSRGMLVKVLETQEGWLLVELDTGQSGYVADRPDFIRVIK